MSDTPKDEKTEEGTARRFNEARNKGQVAFSSEFQTACLLIVACFALFILGGRMGEKSGEAMVKRLSELGIAAEITFDAKWVSDLFREIAQNMMPVMGMFLLTLVVFGMILGFSQAGFKIAGEAISPDLNKLNPIAGFSRILSWKGVMRTVLAILKISVLGVSMGSVAWLQRSRFEVMAASDLRVAMAIGGGIIVKAALAGIFVIWLISILDLIFQRFQHKKDLRMSKQEVKEEAKSSEGDPKVKARIREIQREMAGRRMMADVPDATVVLTNPTHYAVALRYVDDGMGAAPVVVAKGVDDVAQAIKRVARESGVLVYEDPPLARALHRSAEIGDEIPPELFGAVAKVLAYVFRLEGRAAQTA